MSDSLRVLIVDDSRIFRGVIADALSGLPDTQIVGSVWSGEKALEFAQNELPDFVTLDIEMPGIGGLATLKALRRLATERKQSLGVVIVSSHSTRGAAITVECLAEGAFDYIPKPGGSDIESNTATLCRELTAKLGAFRSRRRIEWPTPLPPTRSLGRTLPRPVQRRFRAVVIAASTGGPEALVKLIPTFALDCPVPILVVQHLPVTFTEYFIATMCKRCDMSIIEAQAGAQPQPGVVYLAPGGRHLMVNAIEGRTEFSFSDSPPEHGCRPAADVLFRSAAAAYGGQVLAVVLTGMGSDGASGATVLKRAGGHVIAQDETSSTVWGMPGSVVAAGAAHEVLPLHAIGPALRGHLGMGD